MHGRTIATIQPVAPGHDAAWLKAMLADGRVRWSGGKPLGVARPYRLKAGARAAADMVIEDRG
jgi:hypothetical protein